MKNRLYGLIEDAVRDERITADDTVTLIREILASQTPLIADIRPVLVPATQMEAAYVLLYALDGDGRVWVSGGGYGWHRHEGLPCEDPPAVEPDPIAELEAMGATLEVVILEGRPRLILWPPLATCPPHYRECVPVSSFDFSNLRAAAARLLARVRGVS